jgi:Spy/CpxP family protein refolding chaperone
MNLYRLSALTVMVASVGLGAILAQDSGKAKGRLPANYGKIGLTDEQKQSIYDIMAKYKKESDDLDKKVRDLNTKRKSEIDMVLNEDQKKALKKPTEANKKSEEPKKSDESPKKKDNSKKN